MFLPVFERYLVQRGTGMPFEVTVDENLNVQYMLIFNTHPYIPNINFLILTAYWIFINFQFNNSKPYPGNNENISKTLKPNNKIKTMW